MWCVVAVCFIIYNNKLYVYVEFFSCCLCMLNDIVKNKTTHICVCKKIQNVYILIKSKMSLVKVYSNSMLLDAQMYQYRIYLESKKDVLLKLSEYFLNAICILKASILLSGH